MTIFRSSFAKGDWKVRIAVVSAAFGGLGFLASWTILMIGEYRIFADAKFESPSNNRPFRIEAKGRTYFVEPNYGRNYNLADRYGLVVFAIGVAGAFYVQHRERKDLKK